MARASRMLGERGERMRTLTVDQALDRYRQLVGPVNAAQNVAKVREWLLWGGQATDASLTAYVRMLQGRGLQPGTIDSRVRTIRSFYRHLRMSPPRVVGFTFDPLQDTARPALALETMRTLMQAALDPESGLDSYQRAILAIALVYGPRANELAAIQPQDVEAERLYIRTSKHGTARFHWLAEPIRALLDIDWPEVSTAHVERQFGDIWAVVLGTDKPKGVAWHSIRRGLASALAEAGVPDGAIEHFMRWKTGSRNGSMVALYKNPNQTVTADGTAPVAQTEAGSYAEDAAVWERHPLLIGDRDGS